ncbi:zinc finger C2HC domain-containing protein 1C-like [Diachasmimorpha longicaudata]|uniref:zinc finger C2HC domain-containing protein 1C-like n=1 Tax=Diachasmimorpha longicaudata TaxID=58733 RepID=UPI0030B8CF9A
MPIKSRHSVSRGVSVNIKTSWADQGLTSAVTNLVNMARFQQRQLMEKEQKLLQLYDQQQQRAHQVAQRGSAGSNTSKGSGSGTTSQSVTRTTTTSHSTSNSQGGKVRQMFDERRQTTVKGIDRSYPLEPLENKPRKPTGPTTQKNSTVSSRHSVTVKRTIRSEANGNINNGKPVINYHEEVTRETFGPKLVHQQDDTDEFYNENDLTEWNNSNQEPNTYGIGGLDRGRGAERTKYGNTKKEALLGKKKETPSSGVAPRIGKAQGPEDPRRITSNETKTVSRNNSDITLRPTSRDSSLGEQSADGVDGCDNQARQNPSETTIVRKKSAFAVELEEEPNSKPIFGVKDAPNDRQSPERKGTSQSRQKVSNTRPTSAVSTNSSSSSNQGGSSPTSKRRMATRTRGTASGSRTPSARANVSASNTDSGLAGCKICGRKFAADRLSLHEQICAKTTQKKRKTFDPVVQRVKGTELEPFVKKLGKKGSDKKAKKPEVKSNWRRKHEDFINAIRSAKQMQAHLAAGGKLSDLPPPPASDTSDYIQCPHCGRKFNQGAAERHIPKCEHMLHNKPNPRAPPKPRR